MHPVALRRGHGKGCNGSSIPNHPNSHNGRSGPGHTTPTHSLLMGHWKGARELEAMARVTRGLIQGGMAQLIGKTQIPSNALGARDGATWQGMPYPCVSFKPVQGEWRECGSPPTSESSPCQQKTLHSPTPTPDKTSQHEGSQMNRLQRNCPSHSVPEPRFCCPPSRMIK